MIKQKIKSLKREKLVEILCNMVDILSEEQYLEFEKMLEETATENLASGKSLVMVRMSQKLVDEKLEQIKDWMRQIEEGELYLDLENLLVWKSS